MKRSFKRLSPLAALLLPTLSFAQLSVNSNLGKGFLLFDRESGAKDECVQFEASKVTTEDVRSTSYRLTHLKTKEELMDKLSVSGSAEGTYGTFGGEAKSKFVKEIQWNFNSVYVLIQASRISLRQTISYSKAELKPGALNLLRDSKLKFTFSCGNTFITSVDLGGEIFGLIEIKTDSYSEKQKIENSLSASGSYSGASASGKASYEHEIRKLTTSYRSKIEFRHVGGSQLEVPQTPEELIKISSQIEFISDAHPVALDLHTRDYNTVSNFVFDSLDPEVKVRQNQIDWAQEKLKQARNLYSKTLYVLNNPRSFERFDEMQLKQKLSELDSRIVEMKNWIARAYSFVNTIDTAQINYAIEYPLPAMKSRASRRELSVQCETKPSAICGVEQYREQKSSACGVIAPLLGSGPACGTVYRLDSSEKCGVKEFKAGRGPVCGVELYKKCYNGRPRRPGGARPHNRDSSCGVETYRSCRDQSFGVQEYNTCRDPMHGIEKYETCKHKDFGYEFETCRHFSHGPDSYQSCEIAVIGNQETSCPKF